MVRISFRKPLWLPLVVACLATPAFAGDQDFDGAMQSFHDGRMADAYGRFLALGLKGDPDAARMALFLGENGALVYGGQWELTDLDATALRRAAQRPTLRPQVAPLSPGYDATGMAQRPLTGETLAGK